MLTADVTIPRGENAGRIWFPHFLRGCAALLVAVAHLSEVYPRAPTVAAALGHFSPRANPIDVPWSAVAEAEVASRVSFGWIAVAIFFVVSGFVIPFSLRRASIRGFTVRRFFRIYPTLWACLAITLLVLVVQRFLSGSSVPYTAPEILKNAALIAPYTDDVWIEPVAWTLAIEELFYLTAALMASRKVLADARWILAVGAACCALAFVPSTRDGTPFIFWLTYNLTFLPLIYVGAVIHEVWEQRWSRNKGIAVAAALILLYAIGLYAGPTSPEATLSLRSSLIGIAIFVAIATNSSRIKYSRALDLLGSISYPLYLLHGVNGYVLLRWLEAHGISYYIGLPVAIAGALAGAVLVHYFVELPMMRLGRRLGATKRRPTVPVP
ncbi:MAG: acyltransferase [Actinobacteria bacterium]|nr:acyltransferase [Actinomycetota bacterium]